MPLVIRKIALRRPVAVPFLIAMALLLRGLETIMLEMEFHSL